MHYFKRNIGDYHKKAGRLSMLQHGAYTLLLDSCYDRETFPTMDEAIEWVWASNEDEIQAVKFVLAKFFELEDEVYVQHRVQNELDQYHKNSATNKRIAVEREAKRKDKRTKRAQSVNEAPPNYKPITNNQELITKDILPEEENSGDKFPKERLADKNDQIDLAFDIFYKAGLVKKSKQSALKSFKAICKNGKVTPEEVANKLAEDVKKRIAAKQFGIDQLHPSTYLNGRRWEDDITENVNTVTKADHTFGHNDYDETI